MSRPVLLVYRDVTLPSLAALRPAITKLQPLADPMIRTWVIVPRATPVVALYREKFTCQGRPAACRTNLRPPRPLQLRKLTADSEPASAPDSPPPLRRVPLAAEEVHAIWLVLAGSKMVRVTRPADLAWTPPPGWTVQVPAARAVGTPTAATRTAAPPAASRRAYRLLIAVSLPALPAEARRRASVTSFFLRARAGQAAPGHRQPGNSAPTSIASSSPPSKTAQNRFIQPLPFGRDPLRSPAAARIRASGRRGLGFGEADRTRRDRKERPRRCGCELDNRERGPRMHVPPGCLPASYLDQCALRFGPACARAGPGKAEPGR